MTAAPNKPPAPSSSGAFDALHPTAATLAGTTAQVCSSAANAIQLDEWDLDWLGTHALCLIDAGKPDDANKVIERLAMMDPSDWRASTGRGLIALNAKSVATARLEFASAARSAKDAALISRLKEIVLKLGSDSPTASNDVHRVAIAAAH
jgi:Flp pilus assembly protein TadD